MVGAIEEHSRGRRAVLLIITDGQVGNEREVLGLLRRHAGLTVHVFGIDTAVNDALLKRMARQQRGQCFLMTPNDDIRGAIAGLGERIGLPVLTEIDVEEGWEAERVPDLFSGEVLDIALKARGEGSGVRMRGKLPDGTERGYAFECAAVRNRAVKLLWVRARMDALLAAERRDEAIALAKQNNVLCAGTCFVAWDGAELVPVAVDEVYQPSLVGCAPAMAGPSPTMALAGASVCDAAPPGAKLRGRSFSLSQSAMPRFKFLQVFSRRSASEPNLDSIIARYAGWRDSAPISIAGSVESGIAEIKALLHFDAERLNALAAFLGYWAAGDGKGVETRLALLDGLRDELKAATENKRSETVIRFLRRHCRSGGQMRAQVREMVQALAEERAVGG